MMGADATVVNVSGMSAREEAKGDAIDVYFVYDYNGIPGLIEKYPQYAKYAKVDKRKSMRFFSRILFTVELSRLTFRE